ncbi:MAG: hypothetical protein H2174_04920 [Vampirovibrio sp.]|nr:hypothetical protein [Vampirovibrio sp.]
MKINDVYKGKVFIQGENYPATLTVEDDFSFRLDVESEKSMDFLDSQMMYEFEVLTFISSGAQIFYLFDGWLQNYRITFGRGTPYSLVCTTRKVLKDGRNFSNPPTIPIIDNFSELPVFTQVVFSSPSFDYYTDPDYQNKFDEEIQNLQAFPAVRNTRNDDEPIIDNFNIQLKKGSRCSANFKRFEIEFETVLRMTLSTNKSTEALFDELHEMAYFISLLLASPFSIDSVTLYYDQNHKFELFSHLNKPLKNEVKATRGNFFLMPYEDLLAHNPNFIHDGWLEFKKNEIYHRLFYGFYQTLFAENHISIISGYIDKTTKIACFTKQQKQDIDGVLSEIPTLIVEKLKSLTFNDNARTTKWDDLNYWAIKIGEAAKQDTFQDKIQAVLDWDIAHSLYEHYAHKTRTNVIFEKIGKLYTQARNELSHGSKHDTFQTTMEINDFLQSVLILKLTGKIFNLSDDYLLSCYQNMYSFSSTSGFFCMPKPQNA